jgi:hypothetical protein
VNVDINIVISVYQEKLNELNQENLMLKAMLKQKESIENQSNQEG